MTPSPVTLGVGNTLYDDPKTILLMGDAADTARELTAAIQKKR